MQYFDGETSWKTAILKYEGDERITVGWILGR
jgi:hypothetical protein